MKTISSVLIIIAAALFICSCYLVIVGGHYDYGGFAVLGFCVFGIASIIYSGDKRNITHVNNVDARNTNG